MGALLALAGIDNRATHGYTSSGLEQALVAVSVLSLVLLREQRREKRHGPGRRRPRPGPSPGGMAQLVARRPCKADVSGSNPLTSSLCVLPAWLGSARASGDGRGRAEASRVLLLLKGGGLLAQW